MVNLGDMGPVLPLGALFLAGSSQRGRQFTGGEGGKQFVAGGFAAGSAEFVANEALSMAGIDNVPDELAQAGLAAVLSKYGNAIPQNKAMARGIHYNVATQALQDLGVTAGDLMDGGLSTGNIEPAAPQPQPNSRASNMVTY